MSKTFIAKTVSLLRDSESYSHNAVRVNSMRIDRMKNNDDKFKRHETVKISNDNGDYIIRVIMGAVLKKGIKGITKDEIGLDYDGMDALGLSQSRKSHCRLKVEPATWPDIIIWYLKHPDPGYRVATALGLTGAGLGFIGIVISLLN